MLVLISKIYSYVKGSFCRIATKLFRVPGLPDWFALCCLESRGQPFPLRPTRAAPAPPRAGRGRAPRHAGDHRERQPGESGGADVRRAEAPVNSVHGPGVEKEESEGRKWKYGGEV